MWLNRDSHPELLACSRLSSFSQERLSILLQSTGECCTAPGSFNVDSACFEASLIGKQDFAGGFVPLTFPFVFECLGIRKTHL
jgi:hypothetical protein